MWLSYLVKGILLGFSIAAPVGPIGLLCIRRTLTSGMRSGFMTGLGTATADAAYGCLAAFGVSAVSSFLLLNQVYLRLVGGAFLLYLGYKTFKSQPAEIVENATKEQSSFFIASNSAKIAKSNNYGILGDYSSAFLLTITNPLTIMSFAAVFAGMGVGSTCPNNVLAGLLVLGVFIGSMLWWLTLSATVNIFHTRFDRKRLKIVNQFSGLIILGYGVVSLATIVYH